MNFGKTFEDYLISRDRSVGTIEYYTRSVTQFMKYYTETYGADFKPDTVQAMDLRSYRSFLLNVKKLRPNSVNGQIAALKEFFTCLRIRGYIAINPAEQFKKIQTGEPTSPTTFSEKDYRLLRKEFHKNGSLLEIAIFETLTKTGVRVTELINIQINRLELHERSGSITVLGKGNKMRTIPLSQPTREAIKNYLELRAKRDASSPYLFLSERRSLFTRSAINKIISKYAKRAGLATIPGPHACRHYFATTFLRTHKGDATALKMLQMLLGHSSIDTVLIYQDVSMEELANAIETNT